MPVPAGAIAERRLIDRLLRANAVAPGAAVPLDHLRFIQQRRLERLLKLGVIREGSAGTFYLYAPALADRMASRRHRLAFAMMAVVLLLTALVLFLAPRS